MMKNQLAGLMKQAQAMQDNLKKAQEELANIEVEGQSGAGLVKVTVNGLTFRTTTAVMGGRPLIGFNTANRKAAGVEPGVPVSITVENDTEPRVVEPPEELVAAFRTHKVAKATWSKLSYSHQREYAEWITSAKKPETREARVAKAIERLDAGASSYR